MTSELYLAHPLVSRHAVRKWEQGIEKRTSIQLLNPFYDVYRPDIEDLDAGVPNPRIKPPEEVVPDDLALIERTEGLVAIIDGSSSIGTYQEMVYAYLWNKPIYSIVTSGKEDHSWLVYHSTKIFTSKEAFEEWITNNHSSSER